MAHRPGDARDQEIREACYEERRLRAQRLEQKKVRQNAAGHRAKRVEAVKQPYSAAGAVVRGLGAPPRGPGGGPPPKRGPPRHRRGEQKTRRRPPRPTPPRPAAP